MNGQSSSWKNVDAGVPQGSILGPLLFLIYINDLPDGLISNPKLFADDTSLFSIVYDLSNSTQDLNQDLAKIQDWAFKWKMSFNPDPTKQAQEVIFSRKVIKPVHSNLIFNSKPVSQTLSQKHLGMVLDSKLNFNEHIKNKIAKANQGIGLLRKLQPSLPRSSLLTIYKSFIRPHLDYGDVVYDQPLNETFSQKIESVQYNAALAITAALRGSSKEKLYQELGLEFLQMRRWYRRLSLFYKFFSKRSPSYLFKFIPVSRSFYNTRFSSNIPNLSARTNLFKNTFFPSVINEWNKLDISIRNAISLESFKKSILKFIRPCPNSVFNIHNPMGIKLLTRLRLGLSHLREHKFNHNFQDSVNPLCNCGLEVETTTHFFLHCLNFTTIRQTLLNKIRDVDNDILNQSDSHITQILLFGNPKFSLDSNVNILNASIEFILATERFSAPLFEL